MSDDRREGRGEDRRRGGRDDARPGRGRDDRARDDRGRPRRDERGRGDEAGGPRRDDRDRRGGSDDRGGRGRHDDRRSEDRPRRFEDREDRPRRQRDPEIPEEIEARQLDRAIRSELLTLSKDNADGTARHLVAAGIAAEEGDFDAALEHAQAASRRAGRVAGVRETLGVVHYRRGEWAKALAEFRTARRLSGSDHLLPLMADAERGLGRPERALELAGSREAARLAPAEQIEMAIVVSGARTDLGQTAAAVLHLRDLVRNGNPKAPWAARLRYAYAAALEADGRQQEAQEWYLKAAQLDADGETDAADVLGLEVEPELIDLGDDDEAETPADGGHHPVAADGPAAGRADEDGSR